MIIYWRRRKNGLHAYYWVGQQFLTHERLITAVAGGGPGPGGDGGANIFFRRRRER